MYLGYKGKNKDVFDLVSPTHQLSDLKGDPALLDLETKAEIDDINENTLIKILNKEKYF